MTPRLLSGRAGTPLLVGPEGNEADVGSDATPPAQSEDSEPQPEDNSSPEQTPTEVTPSKSADKADHTDVKTSNKVSDTVKTADVESTTSPDQATSTEESTSALVPLSSAVPTGNQQGSIDSGPPKIQLTSLAYLVPIFVLVVITVGVIIYRKCRPRRRKADFDGGAEYPKSPEIPAPRGWREVAASEEEAEKDDIWSPRTDREDDEEEANQAWRNVQLKESKTRPGLMDVTYGSGRGWFNSARWKPARAFHANNVNDHESTAQLDSTEPGSAGKTMRLVIPRSGPTYMSLLPSAFASRRGRADNERDAEHGESNYGSKRSWKAFSSIAFRLTPSKKQLERNKSPNKRRSMHPTAALPDAPEWILPRATSPDRQILSPPLQPHLFFHPPPLTSMTTLRLPSVSNTESDGTYTDTETHIGSSVANGRNTKATAPPTTPRKHRQQDPDATPTRPSPSVRGKHNADDTTPVQRWRVGLPVLPESPTRRGGSPGYMVNGATGAISSASPKKSRKERKEQKARERVESILQASWSDRALSSPGASVTDLSAQISTHQTRVRDGIEGYGGIDARLAGLRGAGQ